jgi:hypothetical protein
MGIGRIISIDESDQVTKFFLGGGKRVFEGDSLALKRVDARDPLLELAG